MLLIIIIVMTGSCTWQIHAPTVSHESHMQDKPWLFRCETARTLEDDAAKANSPDQFDWVFAEDDAGQPIRATGQLVDGFFEVKGVWLSSGVALRASTLEVRQLCLNTISRMEGDEELMLGAVVLARPRELVNVPPIYPDELESDDEVTRLVIFGDSLTDTGRLKQRLKIFPNRPYWIGRFSNGPMWPEYLGMATGIGIQNHAYGGASAAEPDTLPGMGVVARARDAGQFFVSGTIEIQITDYLERTLADGRIDKADTTAFLIWAGANDYISKEPVSGLITTFLNSPEGEGGYQLVVHRVVEELARYVRMLHDAGARRFLMLNAPDLGRTPIVLQNTTYTPEYIELNESARRMELARRLTALTRFHNAQLADAVDLLRSELPEAEILLVDAYGFYEQLYGADSTAALQPADFGYAPTELLETLEYKGQQLGVQQRCYSGSYLGNLDPDAICQNPQKALFWDTVHPTTLTHCWKAWKIGNDMVDAGWVLPMREVDEYLNWCQIIVDRVTLGSVEEIVPLLTPADGGNVP